MSQRLLRHKPSGITYVYQEVFAARDDFEDVAEEAPVEEVKPVTRAARAKAATATKTSDGLDIPSLESVLKA